MFLLDTNIISELIKKQPNSYLIERMEDVPDTSLYTASVCAMELRFGALRVPNSEALWT
jgi:predicted nucleic acid-binding protein